MQLWSRAEKWCDHRDGNPWFVWWMVRWLHWYLSYRYASKWFWNCANSKHDQPNSLLLGSTYSARDCRWRKRWVVHSFRSRYDCFLFVYAAFVCSEREKSKKNSLMPKIDRSLAVSMQLFQFFFNCLSQPNFDHESIDRETVKYIDYSTPGRLCSIYQNEVNFDDEFFNRRFWLRRTTSERSLIRFNQGDKKVGLAP